MAQSVIRLVLITMDMPNHEKHLFSGCLTTGRESLAWRRVGGLRVNSFTLLPFFALLMKQIKHTQIMAPSAGEFAVMLLQQLRLSI